jgi:hypothetical protein
MEHKAKIWSIYTKYDQLVVRDIKAKKAEEKRIKTTKCNGSIFQNRLFFNPKEQDG